MRRTTIILIDIFVQPNRNRIKNEEEIYKRKKKYKQCIGFNAIAISTKANPKTIHNDKAKALLNRYELFLIEPLMIRSHVSTKPCYFEIMQTGIFATPIT